MAAKVAICQELSMHPHDLERFEVEIEVVKAEKLDPTKFDAWVAPAEVELREAPAPGG